MEKKFNKAISAGIFTILLAIALTVTVAALALFIFHTIIPAYFVFGPLLIAVMVFAGFFAAYWTSNDVSSPKDAIAVSAVAGLVPTLLIAVIFVLSMLFFSLTLTESEFSVTYELIILLISLGCGTVLVVFGTSLSVVGGFIHNSLKTGILRKP